MDHGDLRKDSLSRSLRAFALALCSAVLFLFLFLQIYSCDDYLYLTFLDHGLRHFLESLRWHYANMNGRLLVHAFACAVLHFGHLSVALCGLGILWGCLLLGLRLCGGERSPLTGAAVFFAGLLLLPMKVMQHGILWTSAFFNYVFPLPLLLALLLLLRRRLRAPRLRAGGVFALAAAALVCGGTTELYGLLSCALLGWELLWALLRRKKHAWLLALALAAAAGGLTTIFLSPATAARMDHEVRLTLPTLLSRLTDHAALFRTCGNLLMLLAGHQILLAIYSRQNGKSLLLWLCAAGALLSGLMYFLPERAAGLAVYPALLVLLLVEAFLFAQQGEDGFSALLLSIPLTLLILLNTGSSVFRTLTPFALFLLLALAVCAERIRLPSARKTTLILLMTVGALIFTLPTLPARLNNYRADRENEENAAAAVSSGEMTVRMDYDLQYVYRSIFLDDFFENYLEHYGLPREGIRFVQVGHTLPDVYVNGQPLDVSVFVGDATTFYPLWATFRSGGAAFSRPGPHQYLLSWNGVDYTLTVDPDSTHYHNSVVTWTDPDGTERRKSVRVSYSGVTEDPYLMERDFENVWGVSFRHTDRCILIDLGP